jgi:hypothetical protein
MYYVTPMSALAARWGARILSGVLLLCFGFFLVAHLLGDEGRASRPLTWEDYFGMASLLVSLAGLALAWRWELAGAALTLAAAALGAALNWKVLFFPMLLIPLTAVLFLLSWWMGKGTRDVRGVRV